MAVIGRRAAILIAACVTASLAIAQEPLALRTQVMQVANALSAGNASEAIAAFSKSYKDYDKLKRDFAGLTEAYQIGNEVNFLDDPSAGDEPEMHVHWTMTLGDAAHTFSAQRAADITVRFRREKNNWKITGFEPIDIFDPAAQISGR